jgi:phage I-like protein
VASGGAILDTISSELVEDFYKEDPNLKRKQRLTAIVGASYLLSLRAHQPQQLTESEGNLLDKLLSELGVSSEEAVELLQEIEQKGKLDLVEFFEKQIVED